MSKRERKMKTLLTNGKKTKPAAAEHHLSHNRIMAVLSTYTTEAGGVYMYF